MLKIRLTRGGKKHQPTYRIVVTPKENPVQGQYLASLGTYNPLRQEVNINTEEALSWLNKGAQPSNRIARLLSKAGVEHKSIVVKTYEPRPAKKAVEEKPAPIAEPTEEKAESTDESTEETPTEDTTPDQPAAEPVAEPEAPAEEAPESESADTTTEEK